MDNVLATISQPFKTHQVETSDPSLPHTPSTSGSENTRHQPPLQEILTKKADSSEQEGLKDKVNKNSNPQSQADSQKKEKPPLYCMRSDKSSYREETEREDKIDVEVNPVNRDDQVHDNMEVFGEKPQKYIAIDECIGEVSDMTLFMQRLLAHRKNKQVGQVYDHVELFGNRPEGEIPKRDENFNQLGNKISHEEIRQQFYAHRDELFKKRGIRSISQRDLIFEKEKKQVVENDVAFGGPLGNADQVILAHRQATEHSDQTKKLITVPNNPLNLNLDNNHQTGPRPLRPIPLLFAEGHEREMPKRDENFNQLGNKMSHEEIRQQFYAHRDELFKKRGIRSISQRNLIFEKEKKQVVENDVAFGGPLGNADQVILAHRQATEHSDQTKKLITVPNNPLNLNLDNNAQTGPRPLRTISFLKRFFPFDKKIEKDSVEFEQQVYLDQQVKTLCGYSAKKVKLTEG